MLLDILSRAGAETVERFALEWHGPPKRKRDTSVLSPDVPPALQRFYDVARRWPQLVVQNELLDPPEQRDGERLLFYVENQGVCSWTTGIGEGDPQVWADHEGDFLTEKEPLSRFLITIVILEAVIGSPAGASTAWLHRDRFSEGLGPLRWLPFAPWRGFPRGATFYASDELLAVSAVNSSPESDEYLSVWIGARDPRFLASLDPLLEGWEYDTRQG